MTKAVSKWIWTFILGLVILIVSNMVFPIKIPDFIAITIIILWGFGLLGVFATIIRHGVDTK